MKTILVDAVFGFVSDKGEINEEMHKLLEIFPNKKIILTNASADKYEQFGLNRVPYQVFSLSNNPNKVDPKYYEIMLDNLGLSKDEVIYFEHDQGAIKSAESVGIQTYFYDVDKKDMQALKDFLDSNIN